MTIPEEKSEDMKQVVIRAQNLTKVYRLYGSHIDRLKESLHPLRKRYHQDFYALKDVSLDIHQGETVGIIGRNGSGKSTFLKIATGIIQPSHGEISVTGRISALLELGAGFNPELTGRENIYFSGTIMGYERSEMTRKLDEIIEFADIGVFIDQPVKMYSSGMFIRLAFAVAINVDPDILIIDEALAVGDFSFQARCYRKFNEFRQSGKTVLFVTHSLDSVIRYCDKAVVLDDGHKIAEADAKQAVDIYKKIVVDCHETKPVEDSPGSPLPECLRNDSHLNHQALSYGNERVEITSVSMRDSRGTAADRFINGEVFEVVMEVRFKEAVEDPIFAFTIKDLKGMEITGTNTWYQRIQTGSFSEGDRAKVAFSQKLNLQPGGYALSLGCTGFDKEKFVVHHRLYDIVLFETMSENEHVGFYDPQSNVKIERLS